MDNETEPETNAIQIKIQKVILEYLDTNEGKKFIIEHFKLHPMFKILEQP